MSTDDATETDETTTPLTWVDLFGIDPDYCDGMDIDEWLRENRGNA